MNNDRSNDNIHINCMNNNKYIYHIKLKGFLIKKSKYIIK